MGWRQKYSKAKGSAGEQLAVYALNTTNLEMVERIHTGWKMIRTYKRQGSKTLAWVVPLRKVSGDFRAITPTGQSVLVEVKYHDNDDRILWSSLQKHQRQALQQHHELGGLSLLVWVTDEEAFILRWPVEGLAPRRSVTLEQARQFDLKFAEF